MVICFFAPPTGSHLRADSVQGISPPVDDVDLPLDPVMASVPDSVAAMAAEESDEPAELNAPTQQAPNTLSVDIPTEETTECPVAYVTLTPVDAPASPWRLPLVSSPGGSAIPRAPSARYARVFDIMACLLLNCCGTILVQNHVFISKNTHPTHRATPTRVSRSLFNKHTTNAVVQDNGTESDAGQPNTTTMATTMQSSSRIPPPPARFLLAPASPAQPRDYYTAGTTYSSGTVAGSARIEVWHHV